MAIVIFRVILIAAMATASPLAFSDEAQKLPKIGLLWGANPSTAKPYDDALREGLRDQGYTDGKTVTILTRYANGDSERFPALLKELIDLGVDVLVVTPKAVRAALEATSTIPIISPGMVDPQKSGFVASLAHPGGNLTGLSSQGSETDSKRLGLAMELVPKLKRAALLFYAPDPDDVASAKDFQTLAHTVGIAIRVYGVRSADEIQAAINAILVDSPQLVIVWISYFTLLHRELIFGRLAHRLPMISEGRDLAEAGALLTYSPDNFDVWKRSAVYLDKILKGAKPGDLPIEQPTKFILVVNLKTARALGISVPQSILLRADEVIR